MTYLDFYELNQEPFSNAPVSRFYFGSAIEVELDKPGRILIPAGFRASCQLTERVSFVGLDADRFQLWHPADLDESFRGVRDSAAELLAHLAELGV